MAKSNSTISKDIEYITRYVPYHPSGALYFNQYAYSIVFRRLTMFDLTYNKRHNIKSTDNAKKMEKYKLDCLCSENMLGSLGINYRIRRAKNYTFFLDDIAAVKKIVRIYNTSIINVTGPINEAHLDCVNQSTKQIVKKNLLYGKYRYKISYKATTEFSDKILPSILDFKNSMNLEDELMFNSNMYRVIERDEQVTIRSYYANQTMTVNKHAPVRPWEICTVYIVSEETYCMFKMMVGGNPCNDIEVITFDELPDDK